MGDCTPNQLSYNEQFNIMHFGSIGLRDTAQPIRYLLNICKLQYQQKIFQFQQWQYQIKHLMNLPFPSLPYLTDNKMRISGLITIIKYLIAISNRRQLLGRSISQFNKINQVLWLFEDIIAQIVIVNLSQNFGQQKTKLYNQQIKPLIQFIINNTFKHKIFFPLPLQSVMDIILYEVSYWLQGIFDQQLNVYESDWQQYRSRVEQKFPQIRKHNISKEKIAKNPYFMPLENNWIKPGNKR